MLIIIDEVRHEMQNGSEGVYVFREHINKTDGLPM